MAHRPNNIAFVQGKYGLDEAAYARLELMGSHLWNYWMRDDEGVFQMYYTREHMSPKVYSSRVAREAALNKIKNYFDKLNLQTIAKNESYRARSNLKNAEARSGWKSMNGTKEKKHADEANRKESDASYAVFLAEGEALRAVNEERNNYPPFNAQAQVNNVPAFNVPNYQIKRNGGKSKTARRKSKTNRSKTRRN